MTKLLLILTLIPNLAFGQVTLLEKGDPSPYRGYLLSEQTELDTRIKLQQLKIMESIVIKQQEQIDIIDNRINIKEEQIDNLSRQLKLAKDMQVVYMGLTFLSGLLLGGVLVNGIKK